jgi:TIR domain
MTDGAPPRVFISYSHDSAEHRDRVLELADRLRSDGVDAMIDQYIQFPPEGWPAWCRAEFEKASFVLMVCTEIYLRRVDRKEEPGVGHGVLWEGRLIYQYLYDAGSVSAKFVPVLFADGHPGHIPLPVKGETIYKVQTAEGYEGLLRLLSNQPSTPMPVLGQPRSLPAREREQAARPRRPQSRPRRCRILGSRMCLWVGRRNAQHLPLPCSQQREPAARSLCRAWPGSANRTWWTGSFGRTRGGFPAATCGWLSILTSWPTQQSYSPRCATG